MTPNVGTIDRSLRIIVGLVLIALAASGKVGWWGLHWHRTTRDRPVPVLPRLYPAGHADLPERISEALTLAIALDTSRLRAV